MPPGYDLPDSGLIIITGATGSGKSALGLAIAEKKGIDLISADSRQIYRGMEIGTDAPTQGDREKVRHHFVASRDPWEDFSAYDFAREALPIIESEIRSKGTALVVGGSYLYIRALLYEMDEIPPVPDEIIRRIRGLHEKEGLGPIVARLKEVDPLYLTKVDPNNHRRLIRALEVYEATGVPFSSFHTETRRHFPYPVTTLMPERERETLYERIDKRVDQMIERGLVEEVRALLPYRENNALKTIGYKEIFSYLYGEISLPESIRLIKKNTHTFARHQLTTLRRLPDLITFRL